MKLEFTKGYQKNFDSLRRNEQIRVQSCLRLFLHDPASPSLRNHALKGKYKNFKSISAGGDLRLHYYEKGDKITFVFVSVGSHSQLYK